VAWQGVVAPGGTPPATVDRLAKQIAALFADPATQAKLTAMALEPLTWSTPDSFAIRSEVDRWADIVKTSGATPE
jgi:tripartite-type tricarboxylate transporter receptor subunit TctC